MLLPANTVFRWKFADIGKLPTQSKSDDSAGSNVVTLPFPTRPRGQEVALEAGKSWAGHGCWS